MSIQDKDKELIVRKFFAEVLSDGSVTTGAAMPFRDNAMRYCLEMLDYAIYDNKIVPKAAIKGGQTYGTKLVLEDVWEEDTRRLVDEINKGKDTNKANSSKSSKNTKVRKAVLSEDV